MGGNITGWNFLGGNFPEVGGEGVDFVRTDRDRYYIENMSSISQFIYVMNLK